MSQVGRDGTDGAGQEGSAEPLNAGRRRLIRVGAGAGPVVLGLQGKSALAAVACASPSFVGSNNQSPGHLPPPTCVVGLSPGYWKTCQHLGNWRSPMVKPTFNETCTSGMPKSDPITPGTLFGDAAPFNGLAGGLATYGCWRILAYPSVVDKDLEAFNMAQVQLARHLIATYLNLLYFGSGFPVSEAQIRAMWQYGSIGQYCPLGTGCSPGQLWTSAQVVCYIRNYTMDATSVAADPIDWVC